MKSIRTLALVVLLVVPCLGGTAIADDGYTIRDEAVAKLADALRVRLEARSKRADLLAKAGRTDEALALLESIDTLYEKGMAEIRGLFAAGVGGGPAADGGPFVAPNPSAGAPPPRKLSTLSAEVQRKGVRAAIDGGLRWLAAHQARDGSWSPATFGTDCNGERLDAASDGAGDDVHRVGVTGLALVAFLVNDYTHEGRHPFVECVAKATAFLIKAQDAEGAIGKHKGKEWIYGHALATLALVESYGLTHDRRLLAAAQKAVAFSQTARNPYFAWRYGVKPGDNDTSVSHWMLLGLHSARAANAELEAEGKKPVFTIDEGAFRGAIAWVDRMTDFDYGRVGYITRGSGAARPRDLVDRFPAEQSGAMTAAGINMRLMAGQGIDHPSIAKGKRFLDDLRPKWKLAAQQGHMDMYYWFVGALVAQQLGGRTWRSWQTALVDAVAGTPRPDGNVCGVKGSWDPAGAWGFAGGRVYSTALMVNTLTVLKAGWTE